MSSALPNPSLVSTIAYSFRRKRPHSGTRTPPKWVLASTPTRIHREGSHGDAPVAGHSTQCHLSDGTRAKLPHRQGCGTRNTVCNECTAAMVGGQYGARSCARARQFRDTQIPSAATTVLHIDGRDPVSSLLCRTYVHMDDVRSRILRMPACVSQKDRQANVRTQRVHCTHLTAPHSRSAGSTGAYNILGAALFGRAHRWVSQSCLVVYKSRVCAAVGMQLPDTGSCHVSAPTGSTKTDSAFVPAQ